MSEKSNKIRFLPLFVCLFFVMGVGFSLFVWGIARAFDYCLAKETPATVLSAEYHFEKGKADIVFSYEEDGALKTAELEMDEITYDRQGRLPYYVGDGVTVRINGAGEVAQFTTATILLLVGGAAFTLAGGGFLYVCCIRKNNLLGAVYDYELAMVPPEEVSDETEKTEAYADELSKLPQTSAENKAGLARVWKRRLGDRFKTYTFWQNILFPVLILSPAAAFAVWTAMSVREYTVLMFLGDLVCGFFAGVMLGSIGKFLYFICLKIEIKRGKFCEKQIATVEQCAFESESSVMGSEMGRKYIFRKKFRVVAKVNGKRSVGYVYGSVPPPQGTKLRVLVRAKRYGRFIPDINDKENENHE